MFKYALASGSSDQKASYESALMEVKRAIVINPRSAPSHYIAGRLYAWIAFYTAPAEEHIQLLQSAINSYSRAFELDQKLLSAYTDRGFAYYELGQYRQAIADLDKVLEANPNNGDAYHGREEAKRRLGIAPGPTIKEITQNIHLFLSVEIPLMNIAQFRAIYPEYTAVSDAVVSRKLQRFFYPQREYDAFAKSFIGGAWFEDVKLPELYVNRGDYFLSSGDYRKALIEYRRATEGFPNYADAVERWRLIVRSTSNEYYLDIRTVDVSDASAVKCWLKTSKTEGHVSSSSVQEMEVNCRSRKLNIVSTTTYESKGQVLSAVDGHGWQSIVPETVGETLFNGMCRGVDKESLAPRK